MMIKPTAHKSNPSQPMKAVKNGIAYVTGGQDWEKNDRKAKPIELIGQADDFLMKISNGPHRGKYTHFVVAFPEKELSQKFVKDRVEEFIDALMPGLDTARVPVYANLHRDKDSNQHVHLFVGGVDLATGKRFNAYYHKHDFHRVDSFQNYTNAKFGMEDPKDPAKRRLIEATNKKWPGVKEIAQQLNDHMEDQIENGVIRSRADIIKEIERLGLEVNHDAKQRKSRISIKNPNNTAENARPIALRGEVFKADFDFNVESLREKKQQESNEFKAQAPERMAEAQKKYEELYQTRLEFNQSRYKIRLSKYANRAKATTGLSTGSILNASKKDDGKADADFIDNTLKNFRVSSMYANPDTRWRVPLEARQQIEKNKNKENTNEERTTDNRDIQAVIESVNDFARQVDNQNQRIDRSIEQQRGDARSYIRKTRQRLEQNGSSGKGYTGISKQLREVEQCYDEYIKMMANKASRKRKEQGLGY
ncbi:hypothetical protein [Salinicola sp. MIT1003]|jgi:hypothetical protein|uniref:relaxase/mobilization nuclease domain-containing protein n=1 Tax=Salinicola sp. MIT1003 TaxID=1882734 RepID=UPI0008DC5FE6|nr:hypothetical protein [Salinicola sp. MIT1003]OHZ02994.1 hypothetical protein BC443_14995 [Salinicola sp. MIT1003]